MEVFTVPSLSLKDVNILQSAIYLTDDIKKLIPQFNNFMLDSGAFTFMTQSKNKSINWDEYIDDYINLINEHKIKLYFELDIDGIIGYDKVLAIRKKLERETGVQPIPVWHKRLGKEEWFKMCDEYPYVALGGIAAKEFSQNEHKHFTWFINEAHKRNAKIHGLGYTSINGLYKYHFDSVDSSSWTAGNRFGSIYTFDGKKMQITQKPAGTRVKSKETAIHNFAEWVKFAKWADTHL